MKEFLRTYGILIIATYGVVQIWLIALWKHVIWIGRLAIYKTGRLEVGYSNFGPTLAVNGTLRAERKMVFVSNVSIVVTRDQDGSIHRFEWKAFRSTQLRIGAADPITIELPAAFNVSPDQPHRFNIVFSDIKTSSELEGALVRVNQAWRQYLTAKHDEITAALVTPGVTADSLAAHLFESDFSRNSQEYHQAWDILSRKNYWEAGTYRLRFEVKTSGPDKEFVAQWRFSLSDQDFENLRLNAVATLREICLGQSQYIFAYPDFE